MTHYRIFIFVVFFGFCVLKVYPQKTPMETETIDKHSLGINFYSDFLDFQPGGSDLSEIELSSDFGYHINSTMVIGVKSFFAFSYIVRGSSGTQSTRLSFVPFFRYYIYRDFFCESGIGLGSGWYLFRDDNLPLAREKEDIFIFRTIFSLGYDINITQDNSLVIRPAINYMYTKEKILKYHDSPNNNTQNNVEISFGFFIIF